ncbi:MAG TPA: haloacid dehalogenase-like hydrolase [Gemmatimonadaceae bacterium]
MVAEPEPPLCVDLDGTLIAGDTLLISLGLLLRRQPWRIPEVCARVVRGRAAFKGYVASCVVPEAASLPWRAPVVEFLTSERQRGRRLILATAADHRVADCVCQHLGLFDDTVSTLDGENRRGPAKLAALRKLLGNSEFDYMGDSFADLPLLLAARKAYLVSPPRRLLDRVSRVRAIERIF